MLAEMLNLRKAGINSSARLLPMPPAPMMASFFGVPSVFTKVKPLTLNEQLTIARGLRFEPASRTSLRHRVVPLRPIAGGVQDL